VPRLIALHQRPTDMTVPSHTTEAVDGSVVPDRKLPLTSATNSRSPGMAVTTSWEGPSSPWIYQHCHTLARLQKLQCSHSSRYFRSRRQRTHDQTDNFPTLPPGLPLQRARMRLPMLQRNAVRIACFESSRYGPLLGGERKPTNALVRMHCLSAWPIAFDQTLRAYY
jgi:hypothetical protein